MDIASLFLIILVYALCFFVFSENKKLQEQISILQSEHRELSQRLLTIADGARTLIRDIREDSGDGSYYISSPRYLMSRLENIHDVTGCIPLAAPVKPSVKAAEPSVAEPKTTATDDGGA